MLGDFGHLLIHSQLSVCWFPRLFLYEKKVYAGQVIEIREDGSKYKIKSLTPSGSFQWKWPQNDDILWYDRDDILQAIKAPDPSKRGFYTIKEINNLP